MPLDDLDARLMERLQRGIAVTRRPFAAVAAELGVDELEVLKRLRRSLESGVLSRFGPMFDVEAIGGAYCLCAMAVPEEDFDAVAAMVNEHVEVAHNYRREHRLNMWFVLATESPGRIAEVVASIAAETGLEVLELPKEEEFFVGLHLPIAGHDGCAPRENPA